MIVNVAVGLEIDAHTEITGHTGLRTDLTIVDLEIGLTAGQETGHQRKITGVSGAKDEATSIKIVGT